MITFTKDIENFKLSEDKNFEIVIGQVKGRGGLSIKIVKTYPETLYAMDLVSHENGEIYSGYYQKINWWSMGFRKVDGKWYFYRPSTLSIRKPVKDKK